jgi:hypothetical protein
MYREYMGAHTKAMYCEYMGAHNLGLHGEYNRNVSSNNRESEYQDEKLEELVLSEAVHGHR